MSNLRILPGDGKRDVTAILDAAKNGDLENVLILGWDSNEELFMSGSFDRRPDMYWIMAVAQHVLKADTLIV